MNMFNFFSAWVNQIIEIWDPLFISGQINIFWHSIFVMMSDWLFYRNQNLNVYDILFMPVVFLFSICINRYTSAKQLQICVPDTDVEQYGGFQKVQSCQD